jgi:hypothetical protein
MTSHEQALARLMGEDFHVWNAKPGRGNGPKGTNRGNGHGPGYGTGYGSSHRHGCGTGTGNGNGYGCGCGINSGYSGGNGASHGL